ncbi:surface lipoprotein assembly modifier [Candidatus Spongiihabitans sp.]|uniref:surface lipoprotein assembly modifier n=1 Tax=Candidatus Spongiihabitans sp. TaxID=3101308 RepID=UPI003C7D92C6
MAHLWRALAAALMLALAWTILVSPAHSDSHLSQDAQVNHARWLIENHQPLAALAILRPLAIRSRADITDIRFLIGLSAIGAAERVDDEDQRAALLSEAIAALRAILIEHPQLMRVRLELARAFFLNGDDDLSRRHFERVLAGDPPSAVAINGHRFLHALRARRRWSSYLSFGIEQNDNINSGTDAETIELFGLPFVVNEQSRARADTGLSISGGGEYQLPLGEGKRWRFGVDATRTEYDGHEFDETWLSLRSGPIWTPSQGNEVGAQVFTAQRQVARNRHSKEYGLRFNARHQLTKKFAVNGQASWRKTAYRQAARADDEDANFALGGSYLFTPLLQGDLKMGYSRERVKGGGNRGRNAQLGLSVILPKGWTLGGNVEWSRRRHEVNAPFSDERQVDRKRALRVFALNRGVTVFGFSPQIIATRERQRSNFALDDYQRDRVDLRFVRQF